MGTCPPIIVEISPGELWDKITILRLKVARITDAVKVANVVRELEMLEAVVVQAGMGGSELAALVQNLSDVNAALWDIEDEIRDCERQGEFGEQFIELARSVYRRNDERGSLKRQINVLLRSNLIEEKQYSKYE